MIVIDFCASFYSSVECVDLTVDSHGGSPTQCESHCCSTLDKPSQPKDHAVLQATKRRVGTKSEQRSFSPQWYKDFPWIHLCICWKKVFCFYCLKCYKTGLITFTKHYETAFIVEGFHNWKKAVEHCNRHAISECHWEAISKIISLARISIVDQLNEGASKAKCKNRRMFIKVLPSLQYSLRQGLAVRGHKDEESNLYRLLSLGVKIAQSSQNGLQGTNICHMTLSMR